MPSSGHRQQRQRQQRRDVVDQRLGLLLAPLAVLYSARIGTKACENAPSANRRRSRLGSRKATKKASVGEPGAEGAGDDGVAHEAQDARQQRHAADGRERAQQVHRRRPRARGGRTADTGQGGRPGWREGRRAGDGARDAGPPCATGAKLLLCWVFFGNSKHTKDFQPWPTPSKPASAPGKRKKRASAMRASSRRCAPRSRRCKKAIATGDKAAAATQFQASQAVDRPHRRQADRAQEHRVANQVAVRAGDQGDGLTARGRPADDERAPPGALSIGGAAASVSSLATAGPVVVVAA